MHEHFLRKEFLIVLTGDKENKSFWNFEAEREGDRVESGCNKVEVEVEEEGGEEEEKVETNIGQSSLAAKNKTLLKHLGSILGTEKHGNLYEIRKLMEKKKIYQKVNTRRNKFKKKSKMDTRMK